MLKSLNVFFKEVTMKIDESSVVDIFYVTAKMFDKVLHDKRLVRHIGSHESRASQITGYKVGLEIGDGFQIDGL